MHVAYLINSYPAISHTFIRREIRALEAQNVQVERFALRGWDAELVDPLDEEELAKTRHTLRNGLGALLKAAFAYALRNPGAVWKGFRLAMAMSRGGEKAWPFHIIYLAHACQIMRWLEGSGVTHVHAHFGTNSTEIAALIERMGGPGFSFMLHGSEMHYAPQQACLSSETGRCALLRRHVAVISAAS